MAAYDRQSKEPPKAYSHFCIYRDLGPDRTLEQTAKIHNIKMPTVIELSAKYNWVARCDVWDAHVRALHDRAFLSQVATDGKKRAAAFKALMNKSLQALNALDLESSKPKLNEIASAMKAAAEGMRLEQGLSTANIAMEVTDARVLLSRLPAQVRGPLLRALSECADAGADTNRDRAVPLGIGADTEDGPIA